MKLCKLSAAFAPALITAMALTAPTARAASINCAAARDDVEKAICADAALLERDRAISSRLDALRRACPSQRAALVEGQQFWLRDRWNCRNGEGAFDTPGVLSRCLGGRMDERLRELGKVNPQCDLAPLAASYRFVDVGYLRRMSAHYIGKRVSVFGGMDLASCRSRGADPVAATLVATGSARVRFPARFSAMPDEVREFLCAQHPAAHWEGEVRTDAKGSYLFLTDVLGQPLQARE